MRKNKVFIVVYSFVVAFLMSNGFFADEILLDEHIQNDIALNGNISASFSKRLFENLEDGEKSIYDAMRIDREFLVTHKFINDSLKHSAGGFYNTGSDSVYVLYVASHDWKSALVHELGHRLWYQNMSYEQWIHWENITDYDCYLSASTYAKSQPSEDFAENFKYYYTGKRKLAPHKINELNRLLEEYGLPVLYEDQEEKCTPKVYKFLNEYYRKILMINL